MHFVTTPAKGPGGDLQPDVDGVVRISWLGLGLAASLVLVQCTVSARLGLGMHSQLLIAAVRCVVQLSLLGTILVPIFDYGQLWLVLAYAAFMVWVSAVEAIGRPARFYKGMFANTLLIIAMCATSILLYALLLVIGVQPWWSPQYLIPILGMVLGNAISGISVGLSTVVEELSSGKDQIERLLSLGATRTEATADLVGRSIKLAMTPLLNTMSVVGLVSIPGMMTGQILSGSDPAQAARYQMVIMFLLGACGSTAAVASVYAAVLHVVDQHHRLRPERLITRQGKGGVNGFINKAALAVYRGVAWVISTVVRCCACCRGRQPAAATTTGDTAARCAGQQCDPLHQPLLVTADDGKRCNSAISSPKTPGAAGGSSLKFLGGFVGCNTVGNIGVAEGSVIGVGSMVRGGSETTDAGSSSLRGFSGEFDTQVLLQHADSLSSAGSSCDTPRCRDGAGNA